MSDSLWPRGLPHTRLPCLSPTPGACSNSCPSSQWCHPTISSSAIPFSSHLQSFPASGSFPRARFFASGGQSIGASASAPVLPVNIQGWFPGAGSGQLWHYLVNMSALDSLLLMYEYTKSHFEILACYLMPCIWKMLKKLHLWFSVHISTWL